MKLLLNLLETIRNNNNNNPRTNAPIKFFHEQVIKDIWKKHCLHTAVYKFRINLEKN